MIKNSAPVTHLFLDIGGVLLTNGWDHHSRQHAAKEFQLDFDKSEERHRLIFPAFEEGKFTLDEYLNQVIFYEKRAFSSDQYKKFMFEQSQPYPEMLEWIKEVKKRYRLKMVVVSNEARELNDYRIKKFKLDQFVDVFISSCYVHIRKPDRAIFHLALDVSQAKAENTIYIENTLLFVQMAESLGIRSILHKDYASTKKKLSSFL